MKRFVPLFLLSACTYTGMEWSDANLSFTEQDSYRLMVKVKSVPAGSHDIQVAAAAPAVFNANFRDAQVTVAEKRMQEICGSTFKEQHRIWDSNALEIRFRCS